MLQNILAFLISWKGYFIPYLEWMPELKYVKTLKNDAIAGLTVALILIPQSMAYAQLAGLPAYVGLYSSFLPAIVAALFGSSRQLATGPVAILSLMVASALEPLAIQDPASYMAYAAILAIMVGLSKLIMGLFRMGVIVEFISHPVVVSFTNAAALIIASSQLASLLGLNVERGEYHYQTVVNILTSVPDTHLLTAFMSLSSIALLVLLRKYASKYPNILIAVLISTIVSALVGYEERGGKVVGKIEAGLPSFDIPTVDWSILPQLLLPTLVISLMGAVEAVSISKAVASQTRQRISSSQELIGQGLSNIASGVFHGYPVSGSFSRTAVNFDAGARTGLSSIVSGVLVAVTLLFLTPLLYHLPQATLAAIIIVSVLRLFKWEPIKHAWKVQPHDGFVGVVTFVATLIAAPNLQNGIMLGVVLSLGLYLYRTMQPEFQELSMHEDGTLRDADFYKLKTSPTVTIYRYEGDLYFANTGYLESQILKGLAKKDKTKVLILDLDAVTEVDATGEDMLFNLADRMKKIGIEFYIAKANKSVRTSFKRSGLMEKIGEDRFFRERARAIRHAKTLFSEGEIDIDPLIKPSR